MPEPQYDEELEALLAELLASLTPTPKTAIAWSPEMSAPGVLQQIPASMGGSLPSATTLSPRERQAGKYPTPENILAWIQQQAGNTRNPLTLAWLEGLAEYLRPSATTQKPASNPWASVDFRYGRYSPAWEAAFKTRHKGKGPTELYAWSPLEERQRSPAEAMRDALWDQAWSEDFQKKHGFPPTDDTWRETYWQREHAKLNDAYPEAPY